MLDIDADMIVQMELKPLEVKRLYRAIESLRQLDAPARDGGRLVDAVATATDAPSTCSPDHLDPTHQLALHSPSRQRCELQRQLDLERRSDSALRESLDQHPRAIRSTSSTDATPHGAYTCRPPPAGFDLKCTVCAHEERAPSHATNAELRSRWRVHPSVGSLVCTRCCEACGTEVEARTDASGGEAALARCCWCAVEWRSGARALTCSTCRSTFCEGCVGRNLGGATLDRACTSAAWRGPCCDMAMQALLRVCAEGVLNRTVSEIERGDFARADTAAHRLCDIHRDGATSAAGSASSGGSSSSALADGPQGASRLCGRKRSLSDTADEHVPEGPSSSGMREGWVCVTRADLGGPIHGWRVAVLSPKGEARSERRHALCEAAAVEWLEAVVLSCDHCRAEMHVQYIQGPVQF